MFVISRVKLFRPFLKVSCQSGTLPCFPCFPCVWARVAQQQRRGLHEHPPASAVGRAGPALPPAGLEPAQPPSPFSGRAWAARSPCPVPAPSPGRARALRGQRRLPAPSSAPVRRGQPGASGAAAFPLLTVQPAEVSPQRGLRAPGRDWAAPLQRKGAGESKELNIPLEHRV